MRGLVATTLLVGCGLLAIVVAETDAVGKSKRRNKHAHSHGHSHSTNKKKGGGHSHGHSHSHSPFFFGLGLSYSQPLGAASAPDGDSDGEGVGHAHAFSEGYSLGAGHSHDGGVEASGDAHTTELSISGGYRVTKRLNATLGLGLSPDGIGDPAIGAAYTFPLQRRMSLGTSLTASVPVSDASRDLYKITTITLSSGPTWRRSRWTLSGKGSMSMSYYSKTIIVEEEAEAATTIRGWALQDHDHEHDADHEHDVPTEEVGTGDREFNRFGVGTSVGYRLAKQWNLGFGVGGAYVTHQFGESTIETNATIVQGTYSWDALSLSLGLLTSSADESFSVPTLPSISAGILYFYE